MASLKLLLGMIPSTSKIEQAEKALIAEFEKLSVFSESDQLARYNELNELVNSSDFIQKRKEIESLKYKNSEEYSERKRVFISSESKRYCSLFQNNCRNDLKRFKDLDGSEKINEFEKLEKFIKSPEFREKQKMKPISFQGFRMNTLNFIEYKSLKRDPEVRAFIKSKEKAGNDKNKNYNQIRRAGCFCQIFRIPG